MRFITGLALRRRTVTVMGMILVLTGGLFMYQTLPVELFPEIEFPLITVSAFYPSANPDTVVRDVTAPIERAISGIDGLDMVQSTSFENRSIVLATFTFGTDMDAAESIISSNVSAIQFPTGVDNPRVGRINADAFPVLQLSLIGELDIPELQQILESLILPAIDDIEGVFSIDVAGTVQSRVSVTVDTEKLQQSGISLFQVGQALRENNVTLPAGVITDQGQVFPVKTTHKYASVEELRELVVGFPLRPGGPDAAPPVPVILGDIADVSLGAGIATSISRTNGKPSLGISVLKDPDANTIDVTTGILDALESVELPPGVEVLTISNDGPEIQAQIDTLQREGAFGLLFAVTVVFLFMLTLRPTAIRGMLNTLRPTLIIGLSIPLSIFMGVLFMGWMGLGLNLMTLGGLAISVGRVVDDSIVVLENLSRHMGAGRDRWQTALRATVEVGPAIFASTLTTIAVFVPLAFIQGLVGSFFLPFAQAVTFALVASFIVAVTAIPVLGAYLLKPGDLPEGAGDEIEIPEQDTWMQRMYTPSLIWALKHKAVTLILAVFITVASLGLVFVIPITLFPSGGDRFLTIEMALPPGTPPDVTLAEVAKIEGQIQDVADTYSTTVGAPTSGFGPAGAGGFNRANIFVRLVEDAPENIADILRDQLGGIPGRVVSVAEVAEGGPPTSGIEINITGNSFDDIALVSAELTASLNELDGVRNVGSDVAEARDEISIDVDPNRAALIGLSTQQVGFQVSQFLVGQPVTQIEIDGRQIDVVLSGNSKSIDSIDKIRKLMITGQGGVAQLGEIADVTIQEGPVSISRTDGVRSASVTGSITDSNTQAVGKEVNRKIEELDLPPGVSVNSGGIFTQIEEGFKDIGLAMGIGIVLVYLVMVASLGSLRNPIVIVTSLPLALIGALAALAITQRTLSLPAMMGILLLIGIVVTNAIVLLAFVEQLRERGLSVYDALVEGGRVRLRPILMTAITTSAALLPLAVFISDEGGIIGAELATVVIGGLISSTVLTLIVVPVVYTLANESIPSLFRRKPKQQPEPGSTA